MRESGRDLIRGGHYGQRSCEPHSKAEHMAAPTKPANVKIPLANSEPSTHGIKRRLLRRNGMSEIGVNVLQNPAAFTARPNLSIAEPVVFFTAPSEGVVDG